MALVDWTVTPLSFTVSDNRADVICTFANSATLKKFDEHLFCSSLDSLRAAALARIAQLEETDVAFEIKPALNTPLDLNPATALPTPFEQFTADVALLKQMFEAIRLTVKKAADADVIAQISTVTTALSGNPDWITAF